MPNYFCNECGDYREFQNYKMFLQHKWELHDKFKSVDAQQNSKTKQQFEKNEDEDYLLCLEHQRKIKGGCEGNPFCGKGEYEMSAEIDISDFTHKEDDIKLYEELKQYILSTIPDKRISINELIIREIGHDIANISVIINVMKVNLNVWIKRSYLEDMLATHHGILYNNKVYGIDVNNNVQIEDVEIHLEHLIFNKKRIIRGNNG